MIDEHKIKQQLHRPHLPSDLESKIRANWHNQKTQDKGFWSRGKISAAILLLALLPGITMISGVFSVPNVVTAAASDIIKDQKQQVGISLPVQTVLDASRIKLPPESMPIQMTKICTIDGNKTTHVKIAGSQKGVVHLFIQSEEIATAFWQSRQGIFETMPWKIIQPRKHLSVLVLYSSDMDPINVNKLIKTMFSA